jgi:hypothetical protein
LVIDGSLNCPTVQWSKSMRSGDRDDATSGPPWTSTVATKQFDDINGDCHVTINRPPNFLGLAYRIALRRDIECDSSPTHHLRYGDGKYPRLLGKTCPSLLEVPF